MKRFGLFKLSLLLLSILTITIGQAPDVLAADPDPEIPTTWPPVIYDTVSLCLGDTLIDTIGFWSENSSDPNETVELVEGPGTLEVERPEGWLRAIYKYVPPVEGDFSIRVQHIDSGVIKENVEFVYTVYLNYPPTVEDQYHSIFSCDPIGLREHQVVATDPEGDDITFVLLSGAGSIDEVTGLLSYTPDTSGVYSFLVEVFDICGADTGIVEDTIAINRDPNVVTADDLDLSLCGPQTICFDAFVNDPDGNLETVVVSHGYYDSNTDRICIDLVNGGIYEVVLTATDSCGAQSVDTTVLTVSINEAPVLDLGDDFSVQLCGAQEICFDIIISDDNLTDIFTDPWVNYNDQTGQLCFTPDTSGVYTLTVTIVDECNLELTDTVMVTVDYAGSPWVDLGDDFSVKLCELGEICFDVGVVDPFQTLLLNLGQYNSQTSQICFTPDTSGIYTLTAEVTDSCNAMAYDTVVITVEIGNAPVIADIPDTTVYLCEPREICLPLVVSDADGDLKEVTSNIGEIRDDEICFTPYDAGVYELIVTALDSCGATDVDTAYITVETDQEIQPICPNDTTIFFCELDTACFQIEGIPPGTDVSVTGVNAWFDDQTHEVCFFAECATVNHIIVSVTTDCGTYECDFYVTVECNADPLILLPTDTTLAVCDEGENVCLPVGLGDADGNIDRVEVIGGVYHPEINRICFGATGSGQYQIIATVFDSCEAFDVDTIIVTVIENTAPVITVDLQQTEFSLCESIEICIPVDIVDAEGNIISVITSNGEYDPATGELCFTADTTGYYCFTITATDICGLTDEESFCVTVFNDDPVITAPNDTSLEVCELTEICLEFDTSDADDNIVEVTVNLPGASIVGNQVCFTPDDFGVFEIILTVTDACHGIDVDTAIVTIYSGGYAFIVCPQGMQYASLCQPDSVCITMPITPASADVTVEVGGTANGSYNPTTGEVCVYIDQSGIFDVHVVAEAMCGSDVCDFSLQVDLGQALDLQCPGDFDTLLCLVSPTTLCFPVSVNDPGAEVTVTVDGSPSGTFEAGFVCVPIEEPGEYEIVVAAENDCGSDACTTMVTVFADEVPQVHLPTQIYTFERCPDDTDEICIPEDIWATDAEGAVSITQVCGPAGAFELYPGHNDSGRVCFVPESFGSYEFCFEITDDCHVIEESFLIDVIEKEDCDVCVTLWMDAGDCTPVGLMKNVDVMIETNDPIGGFDLLMKFDISVISLQGVTKAGSEIEQWEYFTHRLDDLDNGLVRVVGIADINNGPYHPPEESLTPDGLLFTMVYFVANDQNLGDQFVPINFVWYDCGDNTFSDPTGGDLYLDLRILSVEGNMIWDEDDDANYPESARLYTYQGAPDVCLVGDKVQPIRCIEFFNGGICIIHPDSIDARGDLNLNEIAYEIGDGVLYTSYFIYGLAVFQVNVAGQIAASDVNADGITLSVADLVFLIRVITGDADPIPKLTPYTEPLDLTTEYDGSTLTVTTDAVSDIGAAHLVFDLQAGDVVTDVRMADDATDMELRWDVVDNQLRLLMFSFESASIPAGEHNLIEISFDGTDKPNLSHTEIVDYNGRPYQLTSKTSKPETYSLSQNYPNPFNPTTTINFTLAKTSDWSLTVYNINGKVVRQYSGRSEGELQVEFDAKDSNGASIASGIYLYRFETEDFADTKKMLLLK